MRTKLKSCRTISTSRSISSTRSQPCEFSELTQQTKYKLWNKAGQVHSDPNRWLAEFLAESRVDKQGTSYALRRFTTQYLKLYKERYGIDRKLTMGERHQISLVLREELRGWVTHVTDRSTNQGPS